MFQRLLHIEALGADGKSIILVDSEAYPNMLQCSGSFKRYLDSTSEVDNMTLSIYNLPATARALIATGSSNIIIKFGYKYNEDDNNLGELFRGEIARVVFQKPDAVTTETKLYIQDTGRFKSYGFVNGAYGDGVNYYDIVKDIVAQNSDTLLTAEISERLKNFTVSNGETYSGAADNVLQDICADAELLYKREDNGIKIVDPNEVVRQTDYIEFTHYNEDTGKYESSSGLIGIPSLTDNGLQLECLVNTRIRPGVMIKVDNAVISISQEGVVPSAEFGASLDPRGLYIVVSMDGSVNNTGDNCSLKLKAYSLTNYLNLAKDTIEDEETYYPQPNLNALKDAQQEENEPITDVYVYEGVTYESLETEDYYTITEYDDSLPYTDILNQVGDKKVSKIGYRAFYQDNLLEPILPDNITDIGNQAFRESLIKTITLPKSLINVGGLAFYNCNQLERVQYKGNMDNWVEINFLGDNANPIEGRYLYLSSEPEKLITTIDLTSANKVSDYALCNYYPLEGITLSNTVKSIGKRSFYACRNLSEISIPNSVTSIGDEAFMNCSNITSISLSNNITDIGFDVFVGCNSLTYYDDYALPSTYLGNNSYKYIVLMNTDKNISAYFLDTNTICIHNSAFSRCVNLVTATLNDKLICIDNFAFYNCTNLPQIILPKSLKRIGQLAFSGCSSLSRVFYKGNKEDWSKIDIKNGNDILLDNVYFYVENERDVPQDEGKYWHYVNETPTIWDNSSIIEDTQGIVYELNIDKTGYILADKGTYSGNNFIIPDTYNNKPIVGISEKAFSNYNLVSITINSNIKFIGNNAFSGCNELQNVIFNDVDNWVYMAYDNSVSGNIISATDLSNSSTAAKYLKSTYTNYYWKKYDMGE